MIVYVNGDSHAAGAEAVVSCAFAEDDPFFYGLGRRPHPENEKASWGCNLANMMSAILQLDAESASSNYRIERTTRDWVENNPGIEQVILIGWSTWEREEWLIDDVHYQVGSSGIDDVPEDHQARYKQFVIDVDWQLVTTKWHERIWRLHQDLLSQEIPHVFFNSNNHFGKIPVKKRYDWGVNFIGPYLPESTYDSWLRANGHSPVSPESWHFGAKAHRNWAEFMLQYIVDNQIVKNK